MDKINNYVQLAEENCAPYFGRVKAVAYQNQKKVLNAFIEGKVSLRHFSGTTGYGYDDIGKQKLAEIFARVFGADSAVVSPHIASGTHAISASLFGILRPGDRFVSITGEPYDTLVDVIGKPGVGSLLDFGISFDRIPLLNNDFNYEEIAKNIEGTKLFYVTRSRGYEWRNALSIEQIKKCVEFIKKINPKAIVFVDNCYGEFMEELEPCDVGVDLVAGSLIKNAGGGVACSGGYICGNKDLVELVAGRLTAPSIGDEIGSYSAGYQGLFQGLFVAPHTVGQSVMGAMLFGEAMSLLGYRILPETAEPHRDIIKSIQFNTANELISFCQTIQRVSPIDSHVTPQAWDMPGYSHQIIMACGAFVQGASIELSCDAPIKSPYIAYLQGGLTYEHVKIATEQCVEALLEQKNGG